MASDTNHFLIGGGVASLAAATLLIRDAAVDGRSICIIEQSDVLGGSLDGAGTMAKGFSTRGGRMFEKNFRCTFDLFDTFPSVDDPSITVSEDIRTFNEQVVSNADCRLVRNGRKIADRHSLKLTWADKAAMLRLMMASEKSLDGRTIESWFRAEFFQTNYWLLWATMFSFSPWHSLAEMRRYMRRFIHLFPGLTRLRGVLRTRYNQHDSLILPMHDWLAARGVQFRTGLAVTDIGIEGDLAARRVTSILLDNGEVIPVRGRDRVYLTLGSMTDASSLGTNHVPPTQTDTPGPAWRLWQKLAKENEGLGNPTAFCGQPEKTAWHSFTVTLDNSEFLEYMERFSGNESGTGGLVTFVDSGWLMSIVVFHQPHFRGQPSGATTLWGYGLTGDRRGDYTQKPMYEATGSEILTELAGQLRLEDSQRRWFDGAKVIPCRMPFITSQFMPRKQGDRPPVRPEGAENFSVIGQYCEQPRDCVFTVEYSVRSAWQAVHEMTGQIPPPPPVVRSNRNLPVMLRAARQMLKG
ncbi:oleate hydratase [Aurantiacibacter sp. MUD11]|uniref:oleate hydratase n=1 Tax=Aurantiacibacter sp. MUD11 TaxID=3003265 RepID=UPI0022AAFB0C|nr:oleate hydratase [Aurantiacibacter sp. MUD11]WAT17356.1 oleate hydratase [Aurantiacibacter sp. MUD11]